MFTIKKVIPLREVMMQYISKVLEINSGNRRNTAKDLGISERGLRNHLHKLKKEEKEEENDIIHLKKRWLSIFATNEERLRYADNPHLNFR